MAVKMIVKQLNYSTFPRINLPYMKHFTTIRLRILHAILSRKIQQVVILLLQATFAPVYTVALLIKATEANRFNRI